MLFTIGSALPTWRNTSYVRRSWEAFVLPPCLDSGSMFLLMTEAKFNLEMGTTPVHIVTLHRSPARCLPVAHTWLTSIYSLRHLDHVISTCLPHKSCIISGYIDTHKETSILLDAAWYILFKVSFYLVKWIYFGVGKSSGRLGGSQWMTIWADITDLCGISLVICFLWAAPFPKQLSSGPSTVWGALFPFSHAQ